jgi:hypothetical protein
MITDINVERCKRLLADDAHEIRLFKLRDRADHKKRRNDRRRRNRRNSRRWVQLDLFAEGVR